MDRGTTRSRRLDWAGSLLGLSLGGFFDGILLHQILQWHHLLSLVDAVDDVSGQILFDGLFHAAMYAIAAAGLVLLLLSRRELGLTGASRLLVGKVFVGFGAWHVLDSVLSHWLLGIHRVKLDSPNPLFWDLLWFAAFGVVPIVIGLLIRRRRPARPPNGHAAAALAALVIGGGVWASQPPAAAHSAVAVFRPGLSDGDILNAVQQSGGSVLWASRGVWAVRWQEPGQARRLYRRGALLVSDSVVAAGCLAWTQA